MSKEKKIWLYGDIDRVKDATNGDIICEDKGIGKSFVKEAPNTRVKAKKVIEEELVLE